MHGEASPSPHGVPDRGLDGGVEADEELQQGLVGGVDLFLGEAPEPEHVAHLVPGLARGAVHGHPERHGRRERRKEEVCLGTVGLGEEAEGEPVARPDDVDLRSAQGTRKPGDLIHAGGRFGGRVSACRCSEQDKSPQTGEPEAAYGRMGAAGRIRKFTLGHGSSSHPFDER